MKHLLFWLLAIALLAGAGMAGYSRFAGARSAASQGLYKIKTADRGDVHLVVNSTGTVQPVLSVQIGAFVSGPIQKVFVNFNDRVHKGQLLAQVDPRTYKSAVAHEQAALAHSRADLLRVKALLEQARRTEKRAITLQPMNAIAETDFDQCRTERESLEAQVLLGESAIAQRQAMLTTATTNLDFTDIKSPVDGIIIDRKIDPGQTVASQFQTPVLFVVAPDLEKKVNVYASVDEADIGLIRGAQDRKQPVTFSVDAYPKDVFRGEIAQVRMNPSTVSNVVTYTVVVEASNTEFKLLPGMTANLAFQIENRTGVLTVPNAALRFHPKAEDVCLRDRPIAEINTGQRHVWVIEDDQLAAVEIVPGLCDKSVTEIVSGPLEEAQELVVGYQAPGAKSAPPPPPH